MRKISVCLAIGIVTTVSIMGCGEMKQGTDTQDSQEHYIVGEAYETTTTELSEADRQREEELRIQEIQQRYAMYEPFGLSYDLERDLFFYEGETVRYFKDVISISETNGFFYENGMVDLTAKRNEKGDLTELEKASPEEFDERTKKHEEMEAEFESGVGEVTYACEEGNPKQRDNTLDAYISYGIKHDDAKKCWVYQGKPVRIFYDKDYSILLDGSVTDGINVKVIRDTKGNIEEIREMTDAEVEEILK